MFNNAIQPLSTKEIWERITSIADYTDDIVKDKFAKSSIVVLEISSRIYQDWSNEKNEFMHTRVTLLSDEEIENNIISVNCGKIYGIFDFEEYIKEKLNI